MIVEPPVREDVPPTHRWSVSVPMMKVWEMRVVVNERRVPVRVRVSFPRRL